MQLLAGVFDFFAFAAISRRWLFWLLVIATALALLAAGADTVEPPQGPR